MTTVIRLTYCVILRMEHPRIWVPPTLFQKLSEIFKNRFPRKSDQNFDILRIRMIHCISFKFYNRKIADTKLTFLVEN